VKTPTLKLVAVGVLLAGCVFAALAQRSNSSAVGAAAPDDGLPVKKVKSWSYAIQPSPTPLTLRQRAPTVPEQQVIDRVRQLLANRPAKAFALLDGDAVIYSETKSPTDAETLIFGYSVGKTVTAMAVGQAICANKLKLYTKASELVPELTGKALGAATVHDLLRMASGAADPNPDSTVWTYEQFIEWQYGNLSLADLVSSDRVAKAQRGLFFDYKPGEHFSYKSTDPILLGIMVSRATNTVWGQWIQERVLNPMGAAHPAQYAQDYQQNGLADGGLYMRLDDWIRFAVLVKRSSQEKGCFGDFVRKAMATQIRNAGNPDTRKFGRLFDGYGYLIWTENQMVPNTAWAVG
jgi:CubicO group peptidase (beta-lactamase class C family)